MKGKNQVVPDEVLSKEFLSQFKTRYRKRCLEVKWKPIWAMKRVPWPVITVAIHAMADIQRESGQNMEKLSFPFCVTATASLSR